jgi:MFS transporter, PAT family, beta-lactamase induction signal transducer AmpG
VGEANEKTQRSGALRDLGRALRSWRTASVALLSFSSGLPLGLVWIAIPDWMRTIGLDIRVVGLITLSQAPWTFKVLWAPLMDRWAPPWLGRRRGWAAIAQVALFAGTLALAGVGNHPEAPWVVAALALAIAFASATQDIAIDAYAVDVLRPDEQGVAVGARTAVYRAALFVSGGLSITLAARWSWPVVNAVLAFVYLPALAITWAAPEPERQPPPPRSLREAIWLPFIGLLARHRALEILAFVVCYKLADQLAGALTRPFLNDMGYDAFHRGFALATIGLGATLFGTFVGGAVTNVLGLGHALWLFGFLQIFSNAGYWLVARSPVNLPLMYGATGVESLTSGMGTGAFSVLLLRLTQKRFSATQYALFSSLFGLPRLVAGPVSGFLVDAIGWADFFLVTLACGLPGMVLLARFVPLGVREPTFSVETAPRGERLSGGQLAVRGLAGGALGVTAAALLSGVLVALKAARTAPESGFDLGAALRTVVVPSEVGDWIQLLGIVVVGLATGLFVAAVAAARRGGGPEVASESAAQALPR